MKRLFSMLLVATLAISIGFSIRSIHVDSKLEDMRLLDVRVPMFRDIVKVVEKDTIYVEKEIVKTHVVNEVDTIVNAPRIDVNKIMPLQKPVMAWPKELAGSFSR